MNLSTQLWFGGMRRVATILFSLTYFAQSQVPVPKLEKMPESLETRFALVLRLRICGRMQQSISSTRQRVMRSVIRGRMVRPASWCEVIGHGRPLHSETISIGQCATTRKAQRHCCRIISMQPN